MYELYAIMIHSGSASGGHYYAYIKDFKTDEWLCFNDQSVSVVSVIILTIRFIPIIYRANNISNWCVIIFLMLLDHNG